MAQRAAPPPPIASSLSNFERREAWRLGLRNALQDFDSDLVLDLLEQHPFLAKEAVDDGRLPLHLALDERPRSEPPAALSTHRRVVVEDEEEDAEDEAAAQEEEEDEAAAGVVAELCELHPRGAMEPDRKHGGNLPLHVALDHAKPQPLIIFELLNRYQSAAGHPTLDGRLPIFIAIARGERASAAIVAELVRASQRCSTVTLFLFMQLLYAAFLSTVV